MRTKWNELEGSVRVSTLTGLVGGFVSAIMVVFFATESSSAFPIGLLFLPALSLLVVCVFLLLFENLSREHRGILGFVVFILSAISTLFFGPFILYRLLGFLGIPVSTS